MQKNFSKTLLLISAVLFQLLLTGCLPGASSLSNGRPDVEVQEGESTGEDEEETFDSCAEEQFYDAAVNECVDICPDTTEPVTDSDSDFNDRKTDFINNDLENVDGLTDDIQIEILEKLELNRNFCFAIKRPDNKINIDEGFCACRNGVPDILGDCTSFCSGKDNTTEAKLFGTVTLDPELVADSKYGNLHNWCTANIGDGLAAPSCVLRAKSTSSETDLNITTFSNSNRFEVNISTLPFDQTFVFRLVEKGSGSNAQTRAKQLMRVQPEDTENQFIETPLKIQSINQYDCYSVQPKTDSTDPTAIFSEAITEQHYYYPSNEEPLPLGPGIDTIFCHDIQQFPGNDSAIYPRLNLIPGHFALWDKTDLRFSDSDANGKRDINDLLEQKITDEFGISFEYNIFSNLPLPLMPNVSTNGTVDSTPTQSNTGFYMTPFTNFSTGEIFCPTRDHYNSNDPVFQVMKEVIGVDTEAIYLALSEATALEDGNGGTQLVTTFIAIRETTLKKIWFYFDNGQHFEHNSVTAQRKPIRFYWPPNYAAPFQRNADQKLYTVGTSEEVTSNFQSFDDGSEISTTITPLDKRFGCVPVIE